MNILLTIFCIISLFIICSRAADKCCAEIGCFSHDRPFNILPPPICPEEFESPIIYKMYSRSDRNNGQKLNRTIKSLVFDSKKRTVFIVHGWKADGHSPWLNDMKEAFLDREDINVIIVDWGSVAKSPNYPQSAANTRTVGADLATIIKNLVGSDNASARKLWCVGHSLGAHICGHAGMQMSKTIQLGRITGLDPAGPMFEWADKEIGLNPTSAQFVDVIHSDPHLFGTKRDIGHVDFYPNGGHTQPGCFGSSPHRRRKRNWLSNALEELAVCSHRRAHQFMIESIKNDCFTATKKCTDYAELPGSCESCGECEGSPCAYMGYLAENSCSKSGIYYVNVTSSPPYCTG